jgi:hypothetical protein
VYPFTGSYNCFWYTHISSHNSYLSMNAVCRAPRFIYSFPKVVRMATYSRCIGWTDNIIRQVLKQRLSALESKRGGGTASSSSSYPSPNTRETIHRLHAVAEFHCLSRLGDVLTILRSSDFSLDTSLTRDGLLFAAFLVAEGNGTEEDFALCITALRRYRWAYSKSEEREGTLQAMWRDRHPTSTLSFAGVNQPDASTSGTPPLGPGYVASHGPSFGHHISSPPPRETHSTGPLPSSSRLDPLPSHQHPHSGAHRSTSISPVSVNMDPYDSEGEETGTNPARFRSGTHTLASTSALRESSIRSEDTASSYRTQTSNERSAPAAEPGSGKRTPERKTTPSPTDTVAPTRNAPSFQKLLN